MERFEFDEEKSRLNRKRHGVDLEWAHRLWDATHVIIPAKLVLGENRFLILGKVEGKCWAAVFTQRGESIRLISCHRADGRLEKLYEAQIGPEEAQ